MIRCEDFRGGSEELTKRKGSRSGGGCDGCPCASETRSGGFEHGSRVVAVRPCGYLNPGVSDGPVRWSLVCAREPRDESAPDAM